MVQNPTPKDETALLPLLRQDCSRVRSEGSTCAIQSNLTSWKTALLLTLYSIHTDGASLAPNRLTRYSILLNKKVASFRAPPPSKK